MWAVFVLMVMKIITGRSLNDCYFFPEDVLESVDLGLVEILPGFRLLELLPVFVPVNAYGLTLNPYLAIAVEILGRLNSFICQKYIALKRGLFWVRSL